MSSVKSWTVRSASIADAEAIAKIHVDSWRTAYRGLLPAETLEGFSVQQRYQVWKDHFFKGRRGLVLEIEGRVVGFAEYGPSSHSDCGEIYSLYLDPQRWQKGGGTLLYLATLDTLREKGFRELEVLVLEGNEPACCFYKKHGLKTDGRVINIDMLGFKLPHLIYRGSL
ncbi:GNAT family N-acetyltransferase [bacterium]|nr:GNAT family N-acetyltransferase [bacterium]